MSSQKLWWNRVAFRFADVFPLFWSRRRKPQSSRFHRSHRRVGRSNPVGQSYAAGPRCAVLPHTRTCANVITKTQPQSVLQRADYQQLLYRLVKPWIKVHWNSRVTFADPTHISITLQNGETLVADMIIGADGIKSKLRETVAGCTGRPVPTGDAAYRAVIPTE